MADEILASIDAAVGCQQCGGPLGDSPSDDFCGPECSAAWYAQHGEPLRGYREPWGRPWDFPGIGGDRHISTDHGRVTVHEALPPEPAPPIVTSSLSLIHVEWAELQFRLPRSTSNLRADWQTARIAQRTATTDAQRAAVALRIESLTERSRTEMAAREEAFRRLMDEFGAGARMTMDAIRTMFRQFSEALRPVVVELQRIGALPEEPRDDPRERALAARRNRNTGPPLRQRPPRRVDPRGVYR